MLTVEEIHTYYGDSHVLQGLSLEVKAGEIVALLGRNGVGKSTLIKSIIGFAPPRQGRIALRGVEVTRLPPHKRAQLGIGLVPQGRGIFPTLSVRENLTLAARRPASGNGNGAPWTLDRVLAIFPPLERRLRNLGAQLSGGEQQMLAIARALMTNPELLLMDEPSEGLAPLLVQEIGRVLNELRAQSLSILLVEQNLSMALDLANRVYVMSKGQIVYTGLPGELQANEEVKHRYLGV
ncbi:MAG: ABC transporter ATP-binding protein [Chloroflexi bacterium RBG_16_63_12]|nr:MAG: ABC transporter ATP-binding protein [Chloroflexi bacterium RBG_16_63_12]